MNDEEKNDKPYVAILKRLIKKTKNIDKINFIKLQDEHSKNKLLKKLYKNIEDEKVIKNPSLTF